jgi:hypothetical protein
MDKVKCATCGNLFTPDKPGRKFCSRECYYKSPRWNKGLKGCQKAWNRQDLYAICEYCSKEYKITASRIGKTRFCSRACQNKWLAQNTKKFGKDNPAFKNGSGAQFYRREAFKIHGAKCMRCGAEKSLLVHHIDGNRKNNPLDGSNWEVLCKRCHQLHHECITRLPSRQSLKNELRIHKNKLLKVFTCELCGKEFHPWNGKQRFCSRSCRNKYRYRNR